MCSHPDVLEFQIRLADLFDSEDHAIITRLLNHYAEEPFGMAQPLPEPVRGRLIEGLKQLPQSRIFVAEANSGQAVGMAICFVGFSTFQALPLINIHDLIVHADSRGIGLGGQLIDAITEYAQQQGCCAVTLEVRHDNPARKLYSRKGFQNLQEQDPDGLMLFGKLSLPINLQ